MRQSAPVCTGVTCEGYARRDQQFAITGRYPIAKIPVPAAINSDYLPSCRYGKYRPTFAFAAFPLLQSQYRESLEISDNPCSFFEVLVCKPMIKGVVGSAGLEPATSCL